MYFGGIDAHERYQVVAVVGKSGERVLSPTRVRTREPDRLTETPAPFRPLKVVVETSPFWPWIRDALVPEGIEFVLAHAKRLRAIAESDHKSDAVDAELLARMLQAGLIPEAHVRSGERREQLRLVRHRAVLVRQRTALLSRIHAQLHPRGLSMPRGKLRTRAGRRWLREEAWPRLSREQRRLIETHFELIDTLSPMVDALDREIEAVGDDMPAVALLRTVPGIGAYRGLVLAAEILPIERFARPAHLVSYAGLAPRTLSSGGRTRHGSIPAGANRWVRGCLVSVSHVQHAPESSRAPTTRDRKSASAGQPPGWPPHVNCAGRSMPCSGPERRGVDSTQHRTTRRPGTSSKLHMQLDCLQR